MTDFTNGQGMVNGYASGGFYGEVTTTDAWVEVDLGFASGFQRIICTSANAADLSWDGVHDLVAKVRHGKIAQNENLLFDHRTARKIFVKSSVASNAATLRIFAW
jgi:hypothetical protein